MTAKFAIKLAIFVLLLAAVAGARPQQVGENKLPAQTQSFTLTIKSNLVVEAVEVKDKQGHFIHGLTAKDVDLKDAIYQAGKSKDMTKEEAVDPLVLDGKRLIPSVTRVFSAGQSIYVYFQAYKQSPTPTTQPLFAYVSLYQGGKKLFETQPQSIVPSATSRLGAMPLSFDLGVDKLPRGQYDCHVTIVDPTSQKVGFWRAPIMLVP